MRWKSQVGMCFETNRVAFDANDYLQIEQIKKNEYNGKQEWNENDCVYRHWTWLPMSREYIFFFYLAGHGFKGLAALKGLIDPFNTLLFVLLESVFDFFGDRVEGEAVDAVSEDDGVVHGIGGADSS